MCTALVDLALISLMATPKYLTELKQQVLKLSVGLDLCQVLNQSIRMTKSSPKGESATNASLQEEGQIKLCDAQTVRGPAPLSNTHSVFGTAAVQCELVPQHSYGLAGRCTHSSGTGQAGSSDGCALAFLLTVRNAGQRAGDHSVLWFLAPTNAWKGGRVIRSLHVFTEKLSNIPPQESRQLPLCLNVDDFQLANEQGDSPRARRVEAAGKKSGENHQRRRRHSRSLYYSSMIVFEP